MIKEFYYNSHSKIFIHSELNLKPMIYTRIGINQTKIVIKLPLITQKSK